MKSRANLAAVLVAVFSILEFKAPWSLFLALVASWITKRAVVLFEPSATRTQRLRLAYLAPEFAELIALCLDSGLPLIDSIEAASQVVGSPASRYAKECTALLRMGAQPEEAFESWRKSAALSPIATVLESVAQTGASGADALRRTSMRLRRSRASQVKRQVRSVGVRATLPIGVCFLPSFILGAVFPFAAQIFFSLLGSLPPVFLNLSK